MTMTGDIMAEWADRDFRWDPLISLKTRTGGSRVNKLMEQVCDQLNANYAAHHPEETFRIDPFDLRMECNGQCFARNGVCRPDLVGGDYKTIRGQSAYFCFERDCRARMKP